MTTASSRLIMVNGYVACLKTTLSFVLSARLGLGQVSTSMFGDISPSLASTDFEEAREARYERAISVAASFLRNGASVVVDGTFSRRKWRERLYSLADQQRLGEIVSITCICSDSQVAMQRLRIRSRLPNSPDALHCDERAFVQSASAFEPILLAPPECSGVAFHGIEFDSATLRTSYTTPQSVGTHLIRRTLDDIVRLGLLSTHLYDMPSISHDHS